MLRKLIIVGIFLFAAQAQAELTIDITQTVEGATPIAIAPFTWTGQQPAPENIAAIIAADLNRSGRFAPLPAGGIADCGKWSNFLRGCRFGIDYLSVAAAAVGCVVVAEFQPVNFSRDIVENVTRKRLQKVAQVGFAERSELRDFVRIEDCHLPALLR